MARVSDDEGSWKPGQHRIIQRAPPSNIESALNELSLWRRRCIRKSTTLPYFVRISKIILIYILYHDVLDVGMVLVSFINILCIRSFPCFLLACVCSLYIICSITFWCRGIQSHRPSPYKIFNRSRIRQTSVARFACNTSNRTGTDDGDIPCFPPSAGNKTLTYIILFHMRSEQRMAECSLEE